MIKTCSEETIIQLKSCLEQLLAGLKIDVARVTKMFQLERTNAKPKGKAKARAAEALPV